MLKYTRLYFPLCDKSPHCLHAGEIEAKMK